MNIEPIKALYPDAVYCGPGDYDKSLINDQVIDYGKEVSVYCRLDGLGLKETARRFKFMLDIRSAGYECIKIGYKLSYFRFRERIQ